MSRGWVAVCALIFLLGLGIGTTAYAQMDSTYVQSFPDTLNLRVLFVQKGLRLRIQDQAGNERYFFTPWHRNYVGWGGFLWNLGFNVLLPVSPSLRDKDLRRFDFQTSLFGKNWMIDGIYQDYQGFVQSEEPFNLSTEDGRLLRNAGLKKIQATVTYLTSGSKFSLGFPYNQGYRQRKSGGSLLLSGDFTYKKIDVPSGILAEEVNSTEPQIKQVESYSFTPMVGYGATLVHRKYYFHVFGLTGLGFQRINYRSTVEEDRAFAIEPVYDVRTAFGRDQGNWYTGVYVSTDYTTTDVEGWRFVGRSSQARVFLGLRFSEPKFLRRIKPKFLQNLKSSPSIPLPFIN